MPATYDPYQLIQKDGLKAFGDSFQQNDPKITSVQSLFGFPCGDCGGWIYQRSHEGLTT